MNKKIKMKQKMMLWMLMILLVIQMVAALGIRPARTTIAIDDFDQENIDVEGTLWIVNNEGREFTVEVYTEGEMADFIKLKGEDKKITFRPEDDAKAVEFEVKFRKEEVPPGGASASLVIEERFEGSGDNTISSKVLLKHKINIIGPYPNQYIQGNLNFHEKGNEIELVAEVKNLGKEDLQKVQTTFYVNDKEKKQNCLLPPLIGIILMTLGNMKFLLSLDMMIKPWNCTRL